MTLGFSVLVTIFFQRGGDKVVTRAFSCKIRVMSASAASVFPPTRWSLVCAAQKPDGQAGAFAALNEWCSIYRKPVVVAARLRHGLSPEDAEDIAQEFITWLLKREHLSRAAPVAGSKFRSFLLGYLAGFIGNWKQRQRAERRGGKAGEHLLVHATDDSRPAVEIPVHTTPDEEIDRAWVVATLRDVRARLKEDYAQRGKSEECEVLMKSLSLADSGETARLAERLGISEGAFKVRVHRFRHEFRERLRTFVLETVSSAEDLEEEMSLIRKFAITT